MPAYITTAVADILGTAPRTSRQWAAGHATAFGGRSNRCGRSLLLLPQFKQQRLVLLRALLAKDLHPHSCAPDEVLGGHLQVKVPDNAECVVVRQSSFAPGAGAAADPGS